MKDIIYEEIDELKEKLENNKFNIEIIVDNGNVFNVYDISDVIYNEEENVLEIHAKL